MSLLSITFHATASILGEWEKYVNTELVLLTENMIDVERYILSEVHTELISEGKNFNLLLIFENNNARKSFLESEMLNLGERVTAQFGEQVLLFVTELDPLKQRF